MPEAPEVERVRRSLAPLLVGSRITAVVLRRRDVVTTPADPSGGVSRQRPGSRGASRQRPVPRADLLLGQTIVALERRGKQLALTADSGRVLLVHLGMTGKLLVHALGAGRAEALPHTHISWMLGRDGQRFGLRFVDPRRFGGLWTIASPAALAERWSLLGPDAAVIDADGLAAAFQRRQRPVKAALLDQSVVAGVGNIYADESLFAAGVAPQRPAATLTSGEIHRLAEAVRQIIAAAIEAGGSTIRDYTDGAGLAGRAQLLHQVYGRAGEACRACGRSLAAAVVAQRTTVWCPACQS